MNVTIPPAHADPFVGGIVHPSLYLWDAWSFSNEEGMHLYCLAVSRTASDGSSIEPAARNDYPFHVRHFVSSDGAATWQDTGCFQQPRPGTGLFDAKTIWSGSITPLGDGSNLIAYTGIRESGPDLLFQQSIGLALSSDGNKPDRLFDSPISCPLRDWQVISELGYYLGNKSILGDRDGEDGGPILAWRDPYALIDNGEVHLFWGAKKGSRKPALAHAVLEPDGNGFRVSRLFAPTLLPDGDRFTQIELPKVLRDPDSGKYYLIVSTCNRLYEGQTDAEVDKTIRMYAAESLEGPWSPAGANGSELMCNSNHMFGMTVLDADFSAEELLCMSPYTDAADYELRLTLSAPFVIDLKRLQT